MQRRSGTRWVVCGLWFRFQMIFKMVLTSSTVNSMCATDFPSGWTFYCGLNAGAFCLRLPSRSGLNSRVRLDTSLGCDLFRLNMVTALRGLRLGSITQVSLVLTAQTSIRA